MDRILAEVTGSPVTFGITALGSFASFVALLYAMFRSGGAAGPVTETASASPQITVNNVIEK